MSICAIAADIMVTTVLICALGRRRTGFKKYECPDPEPYVLSDNACCSTDSMISVITLYTINTGTDFAFGDLHLRLTMAYRPVDRVNQGFQ